MPRALNRCDLFGNAAAALPEHSVSAVAPVPAAVAAAAVMCWSQSQSPAVVVHPVGHYQSAAAVQLLCS